MARIIDGFSDSKRRMLTGRFGVADWRGSAIVWILGVNLTVFIVLRIAGAVGMACDHEEWIGSIVDSLGQPLSFSAWISAPWTSVSYMFVQYEPSHLIFNMLWFALFGGFLQRSAGSGCLWAVYLSGGLSGAVFFLLQGGFYGANVDGGGLIGSSAAVMAVVLAATVIEPERRVDLFVIGSVRLKWIAPVMVAISLTGIDGGLPGGTAAHFGGAVAGILAGLRMRRRVVRGCSGLRPDSAGAGECAGEPDAARLDRLLDRVRFSGFDALSPAERTELFNLSKRLRNNHEK
ncbi:MAG: rhomboid family intramembrane serine protease [Paramuribaculum sp.]|nr:rhomboid family intramembrane serine protease [Paramuribaculum sp.]